jgi:hypothetical protein
VTAAEYHQSLDALPFGKRLPGALYLLDPGADPRIPSLLRITVAELRRRLEIGPEFNLLKFHTASPKLSFLAYPDFEPDPHPTLKEAVIVDLVTVIDHTTGPEHQLLFFKERFLAKDHPDRPKMDRLIRPGLTGSHSYGARRVRSCPNRLQAFGGFQRQSPKTRPARGNHRLRAVEGGVGDLVIM